MCIPARLTCSYPYTPLDWLLKCCFVLHSVQHDSVLVSVTSFKQLAICNAAVLVSFIHI